MAGLESVEVCAPASAKQEGSVAKAASPEGRIKLGLIFLGRKRPGFDPQWGAAMEQWVRAGLGRIDFDLVEPPEKATDHRSLRQAVEACDSAGSEALVLLQTTMADGRMAPTMAQIWPHPVVLWATPENPQGDMISSCSLVGVHNWASILRQTGHPFEIVYGDPRDNETLVQLRQAVRVAATMRRLSLARLGIIGGQAPGYFAMAADPLAISRGLGAQVQTFSLVEFADIVDGLSEDEIAEDVARFKELRIPHKDTDDDDLPMASRLYLAMRRCMDDEDLDALAVRCWPEMPAKHGQWPYLGIARLAEEGRAIACEGDADGALSALVGESLGMGRCYLSDWLEHDDETITLWHGGAAPVSLCPEPGEEGGPRIARHFNNGRPAVIEAQIKAKAPVTIFRLWRCDGRYRIASCDAETAEPRRRLMGTNALARPIDRNPNEWFVELCHAGMPHHVAVFQGHHTGLLRRFADAMGIGFLS
jgi:L-fucose isomerase-like protein